MKKYLNKLDVLDSYTLDRPVAQPDPKVVNTIADISAILKDRANYEAYEGVMFTKTAAKFSALANMCVFCASLFSRFRVAEVPVA